MNDDLISRKEDMDVLKKISFDHWFECGEYIGENPIEVKIINANKALEVIEDLQPAQSEIIMCKDCCHRVERKNYGNLGESAYTCESNMDGWILPDGYCNFAKRSEDGKID